MLHEFHKDEYRISTDKNQLDITMIHTFLESSYWATGISFEKVEKSLQNSMCFGLYVQNKQIGFARVVTDYARIAYLADVFILEEHRGHGLGQWLLQCIMSCPELQGLTKWILVTKDAHGLYKKFGFENLAVPETYMEIRNKPVSNQT